MTRRSHFRGEQTEMIESMSVCDVVTGRTADGTEEDAWRTPGLSKGDLEAEVYRALIATGRTPLLGVKAHVNDGTVILHGCVPTYYMKQLAQQAVLALDGVEYLDNRVTVQ